MLDDEGLEALKGELLYAHPWSSMTKGEDCSGGASPPLMLRAMCDMRAIHASDRG
jgi:hypothetical protein